jgi:hypothetical protein
VHGFRTGEIGAEVLARSLVPKRSAAGLNKVAFGALSSHTVHDRLFGAKFHEADPEDMPRQPIGIR